MSSDLEPLSTDPNDFWGFLGKAFYTSAGGFKWHVRGFVDGCAVVRRWSQPRQTWVYDVLDPSWADVNRKHVRKARK